METNDIWRISVISASESVIKNGVKWFPQQLP
jgi:hypothetical protein